MFVEKLWLLIESDNGYSGSTQFNRFLLFHQPASSKTPLGKVKRRYTSIHDKLRVEGQIVHYKPVLISILFLFIWCSWMFAYTLSKAEGQGTIFLGLILLIGVYNYWSVIKQLNRLKEEFAETIRLLGRE